VIAAASLFGCRRGAGRKSHARLKKAEAAVEAPTKSLKSLRTVAEREGRGVADQAEQKHGDNLSKDLKNLNKQSDAQSVE
jgi:hypothetical protein